MGDRFFFLAGDLAANAVVGALAGLVCCVFVDPAWNMLLAMGVCMPLGMLVATVAAVPLMRWFGAMEVMVPTMLGGMLAGMAVGMRAAMAPYGVTDAVLFGAVVGLVALAFCSYADYLIRGAQRMHREGGDGR